MKNSIEQLEHDKASIVCEFIHNADILKFTFPANLPPDELRGMIEIAANATNRILSSSRATTAVNVNDNSIANIASEMSCACAETRAKI